MGTQLLVRAYRVGCGDCIHVCIPAPKGGFNILIDCGKKGDDELLQKAIEHLETQLPAGSKPGKKRLDLIVATHRHEDHIKGFDPKWFKNIEVANIWMSVAMDPKHPQAKGVNALHGFATQSMRALSDMGPALGPDVEMLVSMFGVSNDAADKLLMETLPKANGIKPKYVHTGMKHGLKLPAATAIHILAPEKDVDGFYLGKELDDSLKTMQGLSQSLAPQGKAVSARPGQQPANISATDFRVLQSRMLSNGLAFAAKDTSIQNNLSVVILIEWKKRRLLFVGDAEWEGEYKEGKHNGSWNVMWEKHRKTHLNKPLDFLKIGHHGSINATPPPPGAKKGGKAAADGVYTILDAILPAPKKGKPKAQAVVSTEREFYNPIPECALMVEVARRVSNTRDYDALLKKKKIKPTTIWVTAKARKNKFFEKYEKEFLAQLQPMRTDLEFVVSGKDFIDIKIPPG